MCLASHGPSISEGAVGIKVINTMVLKTVAQNKWCSWEKRGNFLNWFNHKMISGLFELILN